CDCVEWSLRILLSVTLGRVQKNSVHLEYRLSSSRRVHMDMARFFNFWTKKEPDIAQSQQGACVSPPKSPLSSPVKTNIIRTEKYPEGSVNIYNRFDLQFVLQSIETADCYLKVRFFCAS
ncbi:hypothetical protein BaRGS_00017677, partial [Batillaria attramentaria]